MAKTRSSLSTHLSEIIGPAKEINISEFPTARAVLQHGLFLKEKSEVEEDVKKCHYSNRELARDLSDVILRQWKKCNAKFAPPVIIQETAIIKKVERLWQRASDVALKKCKKAEKNRFELELDRLFDLTACHCVIVTCDQSESMCPSSPCSAGAHIECSCPLDQKIPKLELLWMHSQRNKIGEVSSMYMGSNDAKETNRQIKGERRKAREEEANQKRLKKESDHVKEALLKETDLEFEVELEEQTTMEIDIDFKSRSSLSREQEKESFNVASKLLDEKLGDLSYLVKRFLDKPKQKRNTMKIPNTAKASLRFGVSPAASAAIASSFLQDLISAGHLSSDKLYLVCDAFKLERARKEAMAESTMKDTSRLQEKDVIGISFDGRKDITRTYIPDRKGTLHPRLVKENHISVTLEPSGEYVGHVTPEEPTFPEKPAQKEAEAVFSLLKDNGVSESCLIIGGDSTASNTGWKGGSMAHLETLLGHKCHRKVCMLHTNELPLRHLITKLDGATSSGSGFTGTVGKMLPNVEKMELNTEFEALTEGEALPELPKNVLDNMSTDQKVAYSLCQAVKRGELSSNLTDIQIGPINHARWLTVGARIVYLWTRKHDLTGEAMDTLRLLVKFCLESYFKLFFEIKVKDTLQDASRHILTQLRILRSLPTIIQDIVTPYIKLSAWYAHPESVLLSLLASDLPEEREFAVSLILKQRGHSDRGDMSVRPFRAPNINMNAEALPELISWESVGVQEPVFTCSMTKSEIESLRISPLKLPHVKIHTQSTERAVKCVTEAAKSVAGHQARDGYIRARLHHREAMPVFKTKRDIVNMFT